MATQLKAFLFSRGLPGETAGELAARFALSFESLAGTNSLRSSNDSVSGKLMTVPWPAFEGNIEGSPLGKLVLAHERDVLDGLSKGLGAVEKPVRITHVPFQWDFSAQKTIVSFTISNDALVLTTEEGVGAVERLAASDGSGSKAVASAVARVCQTLTQAIVAHRAAS